MTTKILAAKVNYAVKKSQYNVAKDAFRVVSQNPMASIAERQAAITAYHLAHSACQNAHDDLVYAQLNEKLAMATWTCPAGAQA